MTYPTPPKFGMRDFLEQCAIYGLALIPSFILQAFVPEGHFVRWTPIIVGVLLGIPCGLIIALPARLFVRNPLYRPLYTFLIMIYSMAGTGPLLMRFINMTLDSSPRVAQQVTVLEVNRGTKGGSRITLQHWQAAEASFTITGYEQPGTILNLHTHEGAIGFDWIETVSDAARNDDDH